MKHFSRIYFLFYILILVNSCDRSSDFKVQITNCPKQIALINTDFSNSSFTTYFLFHEGFCYQTIDSLRIYKEYLSGTGSIIESEFQCIPARSMVFDSKSVDCSNFSSKVTEKIDTAHTIGVKLTAIYQNRTTSNCVQFSYQLPCKKIIGKSVTELLDTMSCNTTAGPGDKHLVTFEHQGYCVSEIDSISVYGNFYSYDGFLWNSSNVLIPRERIIFQQNTTFFQKISFKLCITNNYSDYVENQIYLVYKDGSKSNTTKFRIFFDYQNNEKTRKMTGNEISE